MENPRLTEPGVKYFLHHLLQNCHTVKNKYYSLLFNIGCFLVFFVIISLVLFYKYKGTDDIQLKKQREEEKKRYILDKIRKMQQMQINKSTDLITNLPLWNNK